MIRTEQSKILETADFSYVIDKIRDAQFTEQPFTHIEINDLFEPDHFEAIITSPEIRLGRAENDDALFDALFAQSYKIIDFPGCVTNKREYLNWHAHKKSSHRTDTACEGFGMVLRLASPQSPIISNLQQFLSSPEFVACVADKYKIDHEDCRYDAGIQKYLDGYEISPHPDIRSKALTFMVNINPNPECQKDEYHTAYLKLHPEWQYVSEFWKSNPLYERCWVPWDWCEVEKRQRYNNSIVIFSPAHDTLHAVMAKYNHLEYQRTQLYGNLWYKIPPPQKIPRWEDLVIHPTERVTVRNMFRKILPSDAKKFILKAMGGKSDTTHAKRNH